MQFFIFCRELGKMVIECREREHAAEDDAILLNENVVNALRNCGLLKFFKIPSMVATFVIWKDNISLY